MLGKLVGGIAWGEDDSLLAYVSGKLLLNDNRKQLQIYDVTSELSETVFVCSDWFIRSLSFSPDTKVSGLCRETTTIEI